MTSTIFLIEKFLFEIFFLTYFQEGVGSALYIGPSIVDHCCIPNASVSFDLHNGYDALPNYRTIFLINFYNYMPN